MRIRYVLKNKHTGQIHFKIYSIETIELKGLSKFFDIENYDIINRDRFTGLKDKNGVDIYECDVIRKYLNKGHTIGGLNYEDMIVKFENYQWSFVSPVDCEGSPWLHIGIDKWEVIGNVHQNKELLK